MKSSLPRFGATAALLAGLVLAGCGGDDSNSSGSGSSNGGTISLVAYSTPQEAYEALIKAFNDTPEGEGVKVTTSFGASGDQARSVISGLKADVVAFSLEPDMQKLVDEKLVSSSWREDDRKGIVTDSLVVFGVRKGNPKKIRDWDDLLKEDIEVIAPNPATSGGAKWDILAAYGAKGDSGKDRAAGLAYLEKLQKHISVQDKSARESLQTFESGKGDVLLAYENEALGAQKKGLDLDFVIPDDTLRIENPIAVTTKSTNKEAARAFVDFVRSDGGRKIFADFGYRPPEDEARDEKKFPEPSGLFTIDDLGGWPQANAEFFDEKDGAYTRIQEGSGGGG